MTNDEVLDRLKAIECPDATYPARNPALVMERGLGSYVYDVTGRRYIDLCAGFGALALGHNPPAHEPILASRMASAMAPAAAPLLTHGMGDVYPSAAKVDLLNRLLGLLPPALSVAALALTGAQAVELAVKTALLATKRRRFISFTGGYHGLDLGLLPLTDKAAFRDPFLGFHAQDSVTTLDLGCTEAELEAALAGEQVAAVIVEPVQGRAGAKPAGQEWLAMVRRVSSRHGTLLIYDEVFTGLGRCGWMTFAETVPCDLLCLGKALGGGFPLSACIGTAAVMAAWPASSGEALHTGTFFGHPLSCAIAAATLAVIDEQALSERAQILGDEALTLLKDGLAGLDVVREVRGVGLMLAIEFCRPGLGAQLMDLLRSQGIIALASGPTGETLSLSPALTIPRELFFSACTAVCETIATELDT